MNIETMKKTYCHARGHTHHYERAERSFQHPGGTEFETVDECQVCGYEVVVHRWGLTDAPKAAENL